MQSYNLGLFLLLAAPLLILNRIGFWMLFKKAGIAPWKSLVPGLAWWYWVKIVGRPTYYFFLLFVPVVNPIIWFTLSIDLLKSFGRFKFSEQFLGTLFQFGYTIYMGKNKDIQYIGAAESEEFKTKYPHQKSFGRDWADAIWFAVMVASLVRMIYVEPYQIPTSSMERSLRVGDYLFVSKLHNGFRVPSTPISIPFVHRDLMGVSSYSNAMVLPYMRFPGWRDLKAGDASVFNWPDDDPIYPTDKKMNFIKRCVAGPGDSIAVKNGIIYINSTKIPRKPLEQYSYLVGSSSGPINEKMLDKYDVYDYIPVRFFGDTVYDGRMNEMYSVYKSFPAKSNIRRFPFYDLMQINTTSGMLEMLEAKGIIDLYIPVSKQSDMLYPRMSEPPFGNFTADNCGPYYCPKRGDQVDMTDMGNLMMYFPVVSKYEDLDEVSSDGQRLLVDGKEVKTYTFKYNYYWMMGDNRHNSADSRYWGFVPETHILGKPLMVLLSIQYKGVISSNTGERINEFQKLRLDRLFKRIN